MKNSTLAPVAGQLTKQKTILELFTDHVQGRTHLSEVTGRFITEHTTKAQTRNAYRRNLERFYFWYNGQGSPVLNRDVLKNYHRYLSDILITPDNKKQAKQKLKDQFENSTSFNTYISPYTANNYLTTIKAFIHWLNAEAGVPDFSKGLKSFTNGKATDHAKDPLTKAQAIKLLSTSGNIRDAAMIELKLVCALRTVEIKRADIGDIRTKEGRHVLYYQAKGHTTKSKFKVIPVTTYARLMEYLATRKAAAESDPLFISGSNRNQSGRMSERSISRIIKSNFNSANINSPRISAHSLRHTGITFAIENGATIFEAQALAGHADPKTTMIYYHNRTRVSNAAEDKISNYLKEGA